jgi:hypothetical protein
MTNTTTSTTLEITWTGNEHLPAEYQRPGKHTSSLAVIVHHDGDDLQLCEKVFEQTNLYQGELWDRIEPLLPDTRTHTALSVGDLVRIGDRVYKCANIGFKLIEEAGRTVHNVSSGHFTGAGICETCGALCEDDDE